MEYSAKEAYQDKKVVNCYDYSRFRNFKGRITNWLELKLINRALQCSDILSSGQVLDIPCGTGRLSLYLARKGYAVTAVDVSLEMVRLTKEKLEKCEPRGEIAINVEDAENLSFSNGSFDAVVSLRLLGHTPPEIRLRILQEYKRVTRKCLILVYYNRMSFRNILRKYKREQKKIAWYPVDISEVDCELKKIGLKKEKIFHLAFGLSETMVVLASK